RSPALPAGQSLSEQRQRAQRPRHPHSLPRRPEVEADTPAQPVGAGEEAIPPAFPPIELADQGQAPGGGGVGVGAGGGGEGAGISSPSRSRSVSSASCMASLPARTLPRDFRAARGVASR